MRVSLRSCGFSAIFSSDLFGGLQLTRKPHSFIIAENYYEKKPTGCNQWFSSLLALLKYCVNMITMTLNCFYLCQKVIKMCVWGN